MSLSIASLANQTSKPGQEHAEPRHDDAPAGFTNRAMMPEIRSQFSSFGGELFLAGAGDGVEPGAPVVIGRAPFGGDPSHLLETQERRVQSSLVQRQGVAADLLDAAGDSPAMLRAEGIQGSKNHEGERAVEDVGFFLGHVEGPFW